mgnify:CR=1 FL=1
MSEQKNMNEWNETTNENGQMDRAGNGTETETVYVAQLLRYTITIISTAQMTIAFTLNPLPSI